MLACAEPHGMVWPPSYRHLRHPMQQRGLVRGRHLPSGEGPVRSHRTGMSTISPARLRQHVVLQSCRCTRPPELPASWWLSAPVHHPNSSGLRRGCQESPKIR